jgi:hypothetical protein
MHAALVSTRICYHRCYLFTCIIPWVLPPAHARSPVEVDDGQRAPWPGGTNERRRTSESMASGGNRAVEALPARCPRILASTARIHTIRWMARRCWDPRAPTNGCGFPCPLDHHRRELQCALPASHTPPCMATGPSGGASGHGLSSGNQGAGLSDRRREIGGAGDSDGGGDLG